MTKDELIKAAKDAAFTQGLDSALVCAVVEQESGWEPWAIRYEPAYQVKYIAPQILKTNWSPTEATARSFSWGLMQILGDSARSAGFTGHLSSLCDPIVNLRYGCIWL